ncbi:hypothetical protein ARSEF1564_003443 [Beauveria bassiana]
MLVHNYVIRDHATNQTDCNLPCSGDKATICGGKDRINVFDAQYEGLLPIHTWSASSGTSSSAGTPSSVGTQASQSSSVYAAQSTSGAMRNAMIFGNFGRA